MEIIGIVIDWKVAANSHFYRFPSVQSSFSGYFDAWVIKSLVRNHSAPETERKKFSSFLRNVTWLSFDLTFKGSEIGDKKPLNSKSIVVGRREKLFWGEWNRRNGDLASGTDSFESKNENLNKDILVDDEMNLFPILLNFPTFKALGYLVEADAKGRIEEEIHLATQHCELISCHLVFCRGWFTSCLHY